MVQQGPPPLGPAGCPPAARAVTGPTATTPTMTRSTRHGRYPERCRGGRTTTSVSAAEPGTGRADTAWEADTEHQARRRARPGPPDGKARSRAGGAVRHGRAAASARRGRRTAYIWGGAFVAVLLIVAGVGYEFLHRPSPQPTPDSLVTTFQPGEFKTVPNACSAVTAATLNQYLPGSPARGHPKSLYGSAQSLCDWTLDAKPLYRVLQVTVRAYAPAGWPAATGSATSPRRTPTSRPAWRRRTRRRQPTCPGRR